ncbi:hypothetical protein H0Z60_10140 [Ectothiorhodospiraceae bacterium WFHF3C12]|nr:hypothetical protein [Ectothiorhodospiraceae bacterium WFHF3C12]
MRLRHTPFRLSDPAEALLCSLVGTAVLRAGNNPGGTGGGGASVDYFEGFESGAFSTDWTVESSPEIYIDTVQDRVYAGTYGLAITENNTGLDPCILAPSALSNGVQLDYVEFYYLGKSASNGCGFRVMDAAGNEVCGFASSNSAWEVHDGNGWHRFNGAPDGNQGTNGTWTRVKFIFDWANGTFDLEVFLDDGGSDGLGGTETGLPMIASANIRDFRVTSFGTTSRGWNPEEPFDNSVDNIRLYKA